VHTYERLTKELELKTLESQLKEAKEKEAIVQPQSNPLSVVE
jgi:hypothetical protein